jgi:meiotically up-regulated gene 157 (Mug157) protein
MKKYIRLTESDIKRIIKKLIKEQDETSFKEPDPNLFKMSINNNQPNSKQSGLTEYDDEEFEEDDFEEDFN